MVEPALCRHVNHLRIGIAQEGSRLLQAHFHPQRTHREAEELIKQAIEMAPATTELGSQFVNRMFQQLIRRKLFKNLDDALLNLSQTDSFVMCCPEFLVQNYSHEAQQMTAMFEVKLGWNIFNQPVTFHCQCRGRRKKF